MYLPEEWRKREQERFLTGFYKSIPVSLDYPADEFPHLSVTDTEADFIAYTPSDAYGQADRQIRTRFGRYLRKTFESMSDAAIQSYVTQFKSALSQLQSPARLHFATDIPTINQIFETEMKAAGSNCVSCMYGKWDTATIRPYHVYANSPDVAVAYVMTDDRIVARSVVSTKYKLWVRAYSSVDGDNDTDCGTLKELLKEAGYNKGELCGNRLTKLKTHKVMLPYIDNGGMNVRDDGDYWMVVDNGEGDYTADSTDGGATESGNRCGRCNELQDECECIYCECCGESYPDGCDRCIFCEHCEQCTEHNGCDCDRCFDCHQLIEHFRYCSHCTCDRCSNCNQLEDDCECVKCEKCGELEDECECEEDEDEDEDAENENENEEVVRDDDSCVPVSLHEAKHKLNRAYMYLLKTRDGAGSCPDEYNLMVRLVRQIESEERILTNEVSEVPEVS